MNPKIFFGLLIGIPTIILIWIYNELGINNDWQLIVFGIMIVWSYLPTIIVYYAVYIQKDNINETITN